MNNFGSYFFIVCSIAIGCSLASQAGVNSQLRVALSSPVQAAFISFVIGAIILGSIAIIQGDPWFKSGSFPHIPWWAWLGGLFGAFNIAMAVFLVPKLGALTLAISIVFGQVVASLIFDQNGWLGYPKIELSVSRVFGALFWLLKNKTHITHMINYFIPLRWALI